MASAKSQRKRSRPVQKKSPLKSKGVKIGIFLIVIIAIVIAAYFLLPESDEESTGNPIAVFDTTMGTFKIELFEDKTPNTVANFIKLVNDGFYDGMNFYRISDNFMIQAGRYFPDGSEEQSPYGTIEFEAHPDVLHVDGAISMARSDDINSASAEFFICDGEQRELDDDYRQQFGERGYTAFGVTIEGLDVVHEIAAPTP
jgi:cyclophilin family peptidyl-prolyl cis-trans isomerase